jgi:nitrite reductase/ring-hydroxylating ferredoxin subunit
MLTHEENDLLCRVEGAPRWASLMRRHWTPVCLVEEVPEPDGTPVQGAQVLGEELVVFRDSDGRVGVLDEACPHRRASLVYGRNEDGGLRCLYHGWKMDVTATCSRWRPSRRPAAWWTRCAQGLPGARSGAAWCGPGWARPTRSRRSCPPRGHPPQTRA